MASMSDRRRINGPSGGTAPPVFASTLVAPESLQSQRPGRTRKPDELRKICMRLQLILHYLCRLTKSIHSPQDRHNTLSLRIRIPRARKPSTQKEIQDLANEQLPSTNILPQDLLLSPWSSTSSKVSSIQLISRSHNAHQVCALRNAP